MKRKISIVLSVLLPFCIILILIRIGGHVFTNQKLDSNFERNDRWNDYQEKLPISAMDFDQYGACLQYDFNPIGYSTTFTIGSAIRYYEEVDGKKTVAYEIPAGTTLDWMSSSADIGYGFGSFPTYEKGWRWARPFLSADSEETTSGLPWYYVKTSDLEAAAKALLRSNDHAREAQLNAGLSAEGASFILVCRIDRVFYENGIYLSPDLFVRVWTWDCTLMALLFILVLTAVLRINGHACWRRHRHK